jgi:hypothetical protein
MNTNQEIKDPFAFDIQLDTGIEERNYHNRNAPGEIQRPNVVDDICKDLLLQTRIDRIVHGTETTNGDPATLVVFGFRFHGINNQRRFKQAITTILFRDEQKRAEFDPEVIALWPNGDFTLGGLTEIEVEKTRGCEIGLNATAGSGIQVGAQSTARWERKKSYKAADRASLTGSLILDMSIRDYGGNNAVRLTIHENTTANTGLVTDFRAAVLLKLKTKSDPFLCMVRIKAKGNFSYNFVRGLRDLSGFSPPNDPVRFQPGVQYLRPPTLSGFLEDKLAAEIDEKNLNAAKLEDLAGVLGTTVLASSTG